eukprot:1259912-Prymnesium_polylepis.1
MSCTCSCSPYSLRAPVVSPPSVSRFVRRARASTASVASGVYSYRAEDEFPAPARSIIYSLFQARQSPWLPPGARVP